MLRVTSIAVALLAIILIRLSFSVIKFRSKNKVSLGSGGHEDLERAVRAHGNFAEYVPIGLLMIGCLELNGAPWWLVALPAASLTIGRLIHAKGIQDAPPKFARRILGMQLTFGTLGTLAVLNLAWTLYRAFA
jgi:uncharacterized membrane protein YecN with MAPEG domain